MSYQNIILNNNTITKDNDLNIGIIKRRKINNIESDNNNINNKLERLESIILNKLNELDNKINIIGNLNISYEKNIKIQNKIIDYLNKIINNNEKNILDLKNEIESFQIIILTQINNLENNINNNLNNIYKSNNNYFENKNKNINNCSNNNNNLSMDILNTYA